MVVEEGTTKGKASVSKAIHSMGSDGFPQECLWAKHLLERHAPVFLGDFFSHICVYVCVYTGPAGGNCIPYFRM